MDGYPREVIRRHEKARVEPGDRLIRLVCPVKRCQASTWRLVDYIPFTLSHPGGWLPSNDVRCLDRSHGNRVRRPKMEEAEALEFTTEGTWQAVEPRPTQEMG